MNTGTMALTAFVNRAVCRDRNFTDVLVQEGLSEPSSLMREGGAGRGATATAATERWVNARSEQRKRGGEGCAFRGEGSSPSCAPASVARLLWPPESERRAESLRARASAVVLFDRRRAELGAPSKTPPPLHGVGVRRAPASERATNTHSHRAAARAAPEGPQRAPALARLGTRSSALSAETQRGRSRARRETARAMKALAQRRIVGARTIDSSAAKSLSGAAPECLLRRSSPADRRPGSTALPHGRGRGGARANPRRRRRGSRRASRRRRRRAPRRSRRGSARAPRARAPHNLPRRRCRRVRAASRQTPYRSRASRETAAERRRSRARGAARRRH